MRYLCEICGLTVTLSTACLPKGNWQRWLAECAAWRRRYIEARRSVETGLRRPVGGFGRASALTPTLDPAQWG